jgi:putative Mg2+ transporter-C (MgtC) family protein
VLRLGVATPAGGLIGLNRDLPGKPIGLKTLGLVGLATAMVVMLADPFGDSTKLSDAASRIIQGILTGIGFLGAGVISMPSIIFGFAGSPAPPAPGSRRASASPAASGNG